MGDGGPEGSCIGKILRLAAIGVLALSALVKLRAVRSKERTP